MESRTDFFIHRSHHVWFDEYNYRLSIDNKCTPGYLLLQQYPEGIIHNSYLLNFIPCELDFTSNPFSDKKILTHDIDLPPSRNKIFLIYWMMNILQYILSLIQYQIHQPVNNFQHRLSKMCV